MHWNVTWHQFYDFVKNAAKCQLAWVLDLFSWIYCLNFHKTFSSPSKIDLCSPWFFNLHKKFSVEQLSCVTREFSLFSLLSFEIEWEIKQEKNISSALSCCVWSFFSFFLVARREKNDTFFLTTRSINRQGFFL